MILFHVQVVAVDVQCSNPGRVTKKPSPSSIRQDGAGNPLNARWFCTLGIAARPHRSVPLGPFVAVRVSARMPKFAEPLPILSVNNWAHFLPYVTRFTLLGKPPDSSVEAIANSSQSTDPTDGPVLFFSVVSGPR